MRAVDVMTRNVICIRPEATILEAARLLLGARVSALPVVGGDDRLVGLVSEGDLVRRVEIGSEKRRSWWSATLANRETLAAEYIKSHGRLVRDVMTADVVVAEEETELAAIADMMEKHHVKRVPIVRDGKVAGIVSRANLLQALIGTPPSAAAAGNDDATLRERVIEELEGEPWSSFGVANVIVQDGVVQIWGFAENQQHSDACRIAAENVPGVKSVENHLVIQSRGVYIW
ncbi:MAG: CBS domain-containing protein [Alphaproteobacteria bacterium]|nr:CBS domain-containing protein [Alphaproteobacteria bacterium]